MIKRITLLTAILVVSAVVSACNGTAQDNTADKKKETKEYTAEDKEYMRLLNELMMDETVSASINLSMQETGKELVSMLVSSGVEYNDAVARVRKFTEEIMIGINIRHFLPYCKKHLTIEELASIKELYGNEEFQRVNRLSLEAQGKSMRHLEKTMTQAVTSIIAGETPARVERSSAYDDSYLELCSSYSKAVKVNALMDNVAAMMSQAMGNDEKSNRIAQGLKEYIATNLDTMLANAYYGIFSKSDLENLISYIGKPEMQKFLEANHERSKHMDDYYKELTAHMKRFVEENMK